MWFSRNNFSALISLWDLRMVCENIMKNYMKYIILQRLFLHYHFLLSLTDQSLTTEKVNNPLIRNVAENCAVRKVNDLCNPCDILKCIWILWRNRPPNTYPVIKSNEPCKLVTRAYAHIFRIFAHYHFIIKFKIKTTLLGSKNQNERGALPIGIKYFWISLATTRFTSIWTGI